MEQKRRKLFSSSPVRRKLFTSDNTTDQVTRRKLFSSDNRRKLFSVEEDPIKPDEIKKVICMDCGYSMETKASTTKIVCPKCGGTRFNVIPDKAKVEDPSLEKSEEQKEEENGKDPEEREFSEPSNKLEEKLKTYSGKTIPGEEINKLFSETGLNADDLVEKGFASYTDNSDIKILDTAYLQSKLFSKLIISVTKILDLDPIDKPKEEIIDKLAEKDDFEPKSIVLIKKAHSLPIMRESGFSDTVEWINDSGIKNDLHLEFGGSQMDLDKFKEILSERYDDAPEDIIDKLNENNIIKVFGDKVEIL